MAITQAGAVGTGATTVYTSSGTTAITQIPSDPQSRLKIERV